MAAFWCASLGQGSGPGWTPSSSPPHARRSDGDHVLEAGCGAGAASLCLLARVPGAKVTGVEIDPDLAALARDNAAANGFSERFEVICSQTSTAPWTRA